MNKMNKITLADFWYASEPLAIHCDTEEKAKQLLKAFDNFGESWLSGKSYLKHNFWNNYKEKMCYSNYNTFDNYQNYKNSNRKIYEFEDIILKGEEK